MQEMQRTASGWPRTFTYSNWDEKAKMMYHVDLEGNTFYEKLGFLEERVDMLDNPLMGRFLRRKSEV